MWVEGWLDKTTKLAAYQGKGIMTHAVKRLIDYALCEFDLERITIRVAVNNLRSQAIPRRLGFVERGMKKDGEVINGVAVDQIVFEITRGEWG